MYRRSVAVLKLERLIVSRLVCRFRSRAVVELENLALRHQLHVLRRQRPGRLRLFAIDRLLWVLLYRLWPRCLDVMVWSSRPPSSNGTGGASACFGVGAPDPGDRQWSARFATNSAD